MSGYMPMRAVRSAKLMPLAATRTRTSPGCGSGSGASRSSSTLGGPARVIQICLMLEPQSIQQRAALAVVIVVIVEGKFLATREFDRAAGEVRAESVHERGDLIESRASERAFERAERMQERGEQQAIRTTVARVESS